MLKITFDEKNKIAIFEPDGKLSVSDFKSAVSKIDPYITEFGSINGLIIAADKFPGWESFSALISHLTFVKEHHKKISFIAFATGTPIANLAEHTVNHFIAAKIKAFKYADLEAAKQWVIASTNT